MIQRPRNLLRNPTSSSLRISNLWERNWTTKTIARYYQSNKGKWRNICSGRQRQNTRPWPSTNVTGIYIYAYVIAPTITAMLKYCCDVTLLYWVWIITYESTRYCWCNSRHNFGKQKQKLGKYISENYQTMLLNVGLWKFYFSYKRTMQLDRSDEFSKARTNFGSIPLWRSPSWGVFDTSSVYSKYLPSEVVVCKEICARFASWQNKDLYALVQFVVRNLPPPPKKKNIKK